MKKPTSIAGLRESIKLLEVKREEEARILKDQLSTTYENLKPINLIENTIKDFIFPSDFKGSFLTTTLSLIAGYLSKKALIGSTHNPIKKMLGTFLQLGITSIVSKNSDEIKSAVMDMISTIFSKKKMCR